MFSRLDMLENSGMLTVEEAIRARRSVRTFEASPVAEEVLEFVQEYIGSKPQTLPGCGCRLVLLERKLDGKVGTYGVVRNAGYFVAVVHKCGMPGNRESGNDGLEVVNAGIVGERLVLELTRRGIGTVWLGGTFSRGTVGELVKPAPDERVDAVIAFGNPAPKESFTGRLMARMSNARSRKPFDSMFRVKPQSGYRHALEMMRLAPSATNRQEWRAVETDNGIDFFTADTNRFAALDLGIGLAHFLAAAPVGSLKVLPVESATCPDFHYFISYECGTAKD